MHSLRHWLRDFPETEKEAIVDAIESRSLAKIRHALGLLQKLDPDYRGPNFNVELLGTYNLEPILPVLQLALGCLPSSGEIRLAPLDAIEAYISRSSGTNRTKVPDARIILWRAEEALPGIFYPFTTGFPEEVTTRVEEFGKRVEGVISLHHTNAPGVPLFLSTIPFPVYFSNMLFAAQHRAALFASVGSANQRIYELATAADGVHVMDVAAWAAFQGRSYADPALDFMARQPLGAKGQVELALFIARCLRPLIVASRKVLAIDLDNMLWGGVVGEDGVTGLKLGHDFPGNVHLRIQRELVELRNRGVLLVALSKNNESDARQAFDGLPDMLLKWEDFAVRRINWGNKHDNLREVARELGLGLESFVFVDDSDFEREQMRQFLPEVMILNDKSDPLHTLRCLWETDAFDTLSVTEEDQLRHRDYTVRAARDVQAHQHDLNTFLESLEMVATIERVGPANLERVVTLLGKTNQFNLTTRRHSRAEVQAILETPGSIALVLRLKDKFGEQGIVALLLAVPKGRNATLSVDTLLVSCRALGRGVEHALWAAMIKRAVQQGIQSLEAEYRATGKNGMVADFYDQIGLQCIKSDLSSARYYSAKVDICPSPVWINLRDPNDEG